MGNETIRQRAEKIYININCGNDRPEMNGLDKNWIIDKIAEGINQYGHDIENIPVFALDKRNMTMRQQIRQLKEDIKQVRIQRNKYEQDVFSLTRELNKVSSELKLLENYINRVKP